MKFLADHNVTDTMPTADVVVDNISDPKKLPQHLLNYYQSRKKERRYRSLRLSEIDSACPREWVLGHCMDLFYYSTVGVANLWQMNMGTILHWYVQNDPAFFGDKLVGWWQCKACGFIRRFGTRPEEPCEKCHAHARVTEYHEYMFRLKKPYRVVGKVDAILRIAPRVYRFAEIKTCSKEPTSPEGSHVAQAVSYNFFSRHDDALPITIDRSTCYIFYFNKMFNFKGPVSTFAIKPTERLVEPLKEKAALITNGINTKILPDALPQCISTNFSTNSGRAKSCGIPQECKKQFEMGTTTL